MWELFITALDGEYHRLIAFMPRLLSALAVWLLFILAAWSLARVLTRVLSRGGVEGLHVRFTVTVLRWGIVLVGLAIGLGVLGLQGIAASLVASGGLSAVMLGFAFREIGENLLAGLLLSFSRPFRTGDLIRSGDAEGVVRDLSLRTTHVRAPDGRDLFIPNAQIINSPLTNYTLDGLRRLSFEVGVDYRSDLTLVTRTILACVAAERTVLTHPPPRVIFDRFSDAWATLTVGFWIDTAKLAGEQPDDDVRDVRTRVATAVLGGLLAKGVLLSADTTSSIAVSSPDAAGIRIVQ